MSEKRTSKKPKTKLLVPASAEAPAVVDSSGGLKLIQQWFGGKWSAAANVIKSLGPTIISLVPSGSRQYLRHKATSAALELAKEAARAEQNLVSAARAQILGCVGTTDPAELVKIKQQLDFVDEQTRTTSVHLRALERLEENEVENAKVSQFKALPANAKPVPIPDHWTDHFNRLAKQRNEPWRSELLARALAAEASKPGSVSVRGLWMIGTLETSGFEAFAAFLDLCVYVGDTYVLPKDSQLYSRKLLIPITRDANTIGHLLFVVDGLGLLGSLHGARHTIPVGKKLLCRYGSTAVTVKPIGSEVSIDGILPTRLGQEIGSLYDPTSNPVGQSIFNDWKASLNPDACAVVSARARRRR